MTARHTKHKKKNFWVQSDNKHNGLCNASTRIWAPILSSCKPTGNEISVLRYERNEAKNETLTPGTYMLDIQPITADAA